jgi:uncharacterized membrane protein
MARIGRKGRLWLRAFHLFFMGLYIGGVISETVIIASTGSAQSDAGLQAMYKISDTLTAVNGPGNFGTLITGVLLAWLTPWGFFKHKWVIYTAAIVVLLLLVNFTLSQPVSSKLSTLVDVEGLRALQNPEYISAWNRYIILRTVFSLLLVSAAFISVFKPWEKRKVAEATS